MCLHGCGTACALKQTFASCTFFWGNTAQVSGVASTKILGGQIVWLFLRITLFCLEKHLSRHKMTIISKNLEGHGSFGPPSYAYSPDGSWTNFGSVASRFFINTAVLHLVWSSFRWGLLVIVGCYNGSRTRGTKRLKTTALYKSVA